MSFFSKILLFSALTLPVISCVNFNEPKAHTLEIDTISYNIEEKKPENLFFGIPADSFNLITGQIKRNGILSQILLEHGITMPEIDALLKNSSDVFDVRKIRAGNNYFLLCDNDTIGKARYLIYEHDAAISYIFSFRDSLNITPFRQNISESVKYSSGTIETSLWDAMMADSLHPMLAVKLSEIYAWTVDFFGLQKGDSFRVIYEELA